MEFNLCNICIIIFVIIILYFFLKKYDGENFDPRGIYQEYNNTILPTGNNITLPTITNFFGVATPQPNPIPNSNLNGCSSACDQNQQCYGWTFDNNTKKCTLKNSLNKNVVVGQESNFTSGLYNPSKIIKSVGYLAAGNDLLVSNSFGNPTSPISSPTMRFCENACMTNSQCNGWSYNNSTKQCFLKNNNVHKQFFGNDSDNLIWSSAYETTL
ncbi:Pan domain containing protein [Bodo saltans virus]|uniref:Pan domain containing protein n=1 Tax=Bodo saltans virus TaxID=2024608 RepID=A0A2H4UUU3_9VIRU|nr:Pan domain containing protein [Bodo saltans virus]ATZ80619.1 Pan domain containing protein [Bodo saltans virus]